MPSTFYESSVLSFLGPGLLPWHTSNNSSEKEVKGLNGDSNFVLKEDIVLLQILAEFVFYLFNFTERSEYYNETVTVFLCDQSFGSQRDFTPMVRKDLLLDIGMGCLKT